MVLACWHVYMFGSLLPPGRKVEKRRWCRICNGPKKVASFSSLTNLRRPEREKHWKVSRKRAADEVNGARLSHAVFVVDYTGTGNPIGRPRMPYKGKDGPRHRYAPRPKKK